MVCLLTKTKHKKGKKQIRVSQLGLYLTDYENRLCAVVTRPQLGKPPNAMNQENFPNNRSSRRPISAWLRSVVVKPWHVLWELLERHQMCKQQRVVLANIYKPLLIADLDSSTTALNIAMFFSGLWPPVFPPFCSICRSYLLLRVWPLGISAVLMAFFIKWVERETADENFAC